MQILSSVGAPPVPPPNDAARPVPASSALTPPASAQAPAASTATVYPQAAFPGSYASPYGASLNLLGPPFGAVTSAGASASGGAAAAHTVVNATNALASSAVAQAPAGVSSAGQSTVPAAGFSTFSFAQPALLTPALLPVGLPVLISVPVFILAAPLAAPAAPTAEQQPVPSQELPSSPDSPPAPNAEGPEEVAPGPVSPAPVVRTETPVIDLPPVAADGDETAVVSLTNPEFARYSQRFEEQSLSSELVLSLRTAEGDEISLNFRQLDVLRSESFRGRELDGDRVRSRSETENTERFVTIDVVGELSDDERAAIDSVLDGVTRIANEFFSGDYQGARAELEALDFDADTLSELSLNLTSTRQTEIARSYRGASDPLDQLRNRGGQIVQALEFLASEQRQLIEQAKEVLEDGSAAKLVRTLVPSLLGDSIDDLRAKLSEATDSPDAQSPSADVVA